MAFTSITCGEGYVLRKKLEFEYKVTERTKIDFNFRRIIQISDFAELIEALIPDNKNQQYAGICLFFELKWAKRIVPNLAYMEKRYDISHRILQRTRAKLSRIGLIEHISYLNNRYGGQYGWKLSTCFERSLNKLASKCAFLRITGTSSKEKEAILLDFANARRNIPKYAVREFSEKNRMEVKLIEP